jgi:putative nucleotidyltransferase-like protein
LDQRKGGLRRHAIKRGIGSQPEHELLLLCAAARLDPESGERIKHLAQQQLDWDYLVRLARRHCVLPLLYQKLQIYADRATPVAVRENLRDRFHENAAHSLLLAGELARIAGTLKSEGIGTLAFKGPALAMLAYGDVSSRRYVDLDLIVQPCDVARAREVLGRLGFSAPEYLSPSGDDLLERWQHGVGLVRADDGLMVELHWRIAANGFATLPFEPDMWKRAIGVSICGVRVNTLSPEDLLVALCIHGAKHFWERLAWVCDVARLLSLDQQLDWSLVFRLAGEAGVERMLALGLCLAVELFSVELPADLLRRVHSDTIVFDLAAQVTTRMFDGADFRPLSFQHALRFNLRARSRWLEKVRYCGYVLAPTDADLATRALPARLEFAYYLLRPFRLMWRERETCGAEIRRSQSLT